MTPAKILVVEDDPGIGANLTRALVTQGYDADLVGTGADALAAIATRPPDAVLLDLGLPDVDGIDLCRTMLDRQPGLTVLMLTARRAEIDVVVGLDAGAVDYVAKPFRLAELLARLRAHLRRPDGEAAGPITVGRLTVDRDAHRAWLRDEELALRPKEFVLLATLAAQAGTALTREHLMSEVWDEHWFGSTKTLDVHVAALRQKLGAAGDSSGITTLRGIGYRMEPSGPAPPPAP